MLTKVSFLIGGNQSIQCTFWPHFISALGRTTDCARPQVCWCVGHVCRRSLQECFRAFTSPLQFPLRHLIDEPVSVPLWWQDVQSCSQEVHGALSRRCRSLTHIWLSKQNPKYSFLSYHATQHEWNKTCILLEGGTWTTLLFPIDTVDVLGEGGRRGRENQNPDWMSWGQSPTEQRASALWTPPCWIFLGRKHSVLPHATQQLKKNQHIQTR